MTFTFYRHVCTKILLPCHVSAAEIYHRKVSRYFDDVIVSGYKLLHHIEALDGMVVKEIRLFRDCVVLSTMYWASRYVFVLLFKKSFYIIVSSYEVRKIDLSKSPVVTYNCRKLSPIWTILSASDFVQNCRINCSKSCINVL